MLAKNLRIALAMKDWTQTELAERSGLSQSYISKICKGRYTPSRQTIRLIADTLGMTEEELNPEETQTDSEEEPEQLAC